MPLENQVIIVTGSSRGIGQAIALLFSREGARVVVVSRHVDACETVAGRIRSEGGQALVVPTDVADEAQVAHLVQATLAHFGRVDGLVNAAGIGLLVALPDTTLEMWQRTLDVNLTGTFLCCRAVWEPMARQGGGHILNISSSVVKDPHAGWSAYCASKAGVVALTESLAKEGYPLGIRVNVLLPGATATKMRLTNFPSDDPAQLLAPEDVAKVASFFSADAATHLYGANLEVRKRPRGL